MWPIIGTKARNRMIIVAKIANPNPFIEMRVISKEIERLIVEADSFVCDNFGGVYHLRSLGFGKFCQRWRALLTFRLFQVAVEGNSRGAG